MSALLLLPRVIPPAGSPADVVWTGESQPRSSSFSGATTGTITVNHPGGIPVAMTWAVSGDLISATFDGQPATIVQQNTAFYRNALLVAPATAAGSKQWAFTFASGGGPSGNLDIVTAAIDGNGSLQSSALGNDTNALDKVANVTVPANGVAVILMVNTASDATINYPAGQSIVYSTDGGAFKVAERFTSGGAGFDVIGTGGSSFGIVGVMVFSGGSGVEPVYKGRSVRRFKYLGAQSSPAPYLGARALFPA
jgi:hypothetical protein